MPKLKTGTVIPTPQEDAVITAGADADRDARPFTDAEWQAVKPLVRRGRPLGITKEQITLRIDTDVLEAYRASGPGWHTLINDTLKRSIKAGKAPEVKGRRAP